MSITYGVFHQQCNDGSDNGGDDNGGDDNLSNGCGGWWWLVMMILNSNGDNDSNTFLNV